MTESDDALSVAVASLRDLAERDVSEHVAVFEAVHEAMRHELDDGQDA